MAAREDRFISIDRNIAANLRLHREAGSISQEELAQRMADRGFGFTQATIWKIEAGQRPVKASELVALADSLEIMSVVSLTEEPGTERHYVRLQQANRNAYDTYAALKVAAAAYLEAQYNLVYAARQAHDHGLTVTDQHTSWLEIPGEQAVIEARIETDQEEAQAQQVDGEVDKVLDALRAAGYNPTLHIEDVQYEGGEPQPVQAPAQPGGR